MPITQITSEHVAEPAPNLWSNCLLVNGVCYISGMTGRDKNMEPVDGTDEYEQTKVIFDKMKHLVSAAGGSMADITKLTIFVTDIANREKVWKARAEFFEGDFPACSLVEVSALADPRILVEIEGVAHLGQSA